MTSLVVAQVFIAITLVLMVIGKTPMYLTAVVGSFCAAVAAGIPLTGSADVTVRKLLISGLNPVLIDMCGILLFIGIMKATGYLHKIVGDVIKAGNYIGGGPGIISAAAIVAGGIGMMVGFTQAAITGVVAGPAAIKLGVDKNDAAGALQHANILGCGAGFSHPTVVGFLSLTAVGYGMFNVWGLVVAAAVIGVAWWRMVQQVRHSTGFKKFTKEDIVQILNDFNKGASANITSWKAFLPFILLIVGASSGIPIFIVCFFCAVLVILLAKYNLQQGQTAMIEGVKLLAVPFVATVIFLFMSGVIKNVGFVDLLAKWFEPLLKYSPEILMFVVSIITGVVTQSLAASAAILLPFVSVVLGAGGDPMATAVAATAGANIGQYYLTGGPVSGLNTVIPVVPGSDLTTANKFQRPNYFFGWAAAALIVAFLTFA